MKEIVSRLGGIERIYNLSALPRVTVAKSNSPFPALLAQLVRWFALLFTAEGKMRGNARHWLQTAEKVFNFRCDKLNEAERAELQQKRESLRGFLRDNADTAKLKLGIEVLEGVLRRVGGKIYPHSIIQEYVEFFVVAAIVVLSVRVYFVQPFKIPTNSMWPSYNGMTPFVYHDEATVPGPVGKLVRLLCFGAVHQEVIAPHDGQIVVPVFLDIEGHGHLAYQKKPGRKWWVFPAVVREYGVYIGDEPVRFEVPEDFDFEWAFRDTFGFSTSQFDDFVRKARSGGGTSPWVLLGREAIKGKPLFSFDIMTGDNLFVDRLSYHFNPPKPGEGFVFRTENIDSPNMRDEKGNQIVSYYIKRLAGGPGDKIEIREPVLYRNGQPITGASSYEKNARREGLYRGYQNYGLLKAGNVVEVPADGFFALGDNSYNSGDGRMWGFVPRKDVVGRPLFVYYPFNNHWGPAR